VEAIDVSGYEGAEIVHDLSNPVPDHLHAQFDFVFDGSTLDNVFDPVATLRNIADLLAPAGRALLMNWSNSSPTAYTMCSPDWFMDYFAANDFEDAQVFIIECGHGYGCAWRFEPLSSEADAGLAYRPSDVQSETLRATLCLIEKGTKTTTHKRPVQVHYRSDEEREGYIERAQRFSVSPRAQFRFPRIGQISKRESISASGALLNRGDSR
jgi:SAM-dependent methyltransferase